MAIQQRQEIDSPRVRRFYAEAGGENMFDSRFLTPAIRRYLAEESGLLTRIFAERGYTHLIEVGCGYGRYLKWALAGDVHYDGIDLVDWMTEFGQVRLEQLAGVKPELHRAIYNLGVEALPELLFERRRVDGPVRTLALFPFNCFGNLENLEETLQALRGMGCDVLIATYDRHEEATMERLAYYERCGYRRLAWEDTPDGTLITSQEGFRSLAFTPDYLDSLMRSGGFEPGAVSPFAGIGQGHLYHHFEAVEASTGVRSTVDRREFNRKARMLKAWITVVQEDILDDSLLLAMERDEVEVVNLSLDGILVHHVTPCDAGALIRLRIREAHRGGVDLEVFSVVQRSTVVGPDLHELALKIVRLSSQQRHRLRNLLTSL